MKKLLFYTIICTLYFLVPVCLIASLGTMVSAKYEVDEKYWLIEGSTKLTAEQKQEEIEFLNQKGRKFKYKGYAFLFIACVTFTTGTLLLFKRKSISPKLLEV